MFEPGWHINLFQAILVKSENKLHTATSSDNSSNISINGNIDVCSGAGTRAGVGVDCDDFGINNNSKVIFDDILIKVRKLLYYCFFNFLSLCIDVWYFDGMIAIGINELIVFGVPALINIQIC